MSSLEKPEMAAISSSFNFPFASMASTISILVSCLVSRLVSILALAKQQAISSFVVISLGSVKGLSLRLRFC